MDYPKLLIISHNLYDTSNNIGKTLVSLLDGWPVEKICQIYFRNDMPSYKYCKEYYCITDKEIFKSAISFRHILAGEELVESSLREASKAENNLYQIGNHRRPIISLIRDVMWSNANWANGNIDKWLSKVSPDLILFVPNDYCLAYDVALYVRKKINKPVIPFYMDDAFYYNCKSDLIDSLRRKEIRKRAEGVHRHSSKIFTICEKMSVEYQQRFALTCSDFMNSVSLTQEEIVEAKKKIDNTTDSKNLIASYIGNLHSNRWKSIVEIGKCFDKLNDKGYKTKLRIFSGSVIEKEMKDAFASCQCIEFMGRLEVDQVRKYQMLSDILIHVEAFDLKSKNSTRLSLSTKIPEYLSTGVCIFAYGPSDIASIQYLEINKIAFVCTDKGSLNSIASAIVTHPETRKKYAQNGLCVAFEKHDIKKVSISFKNTLIEQSKKIDR